MPTTYRALLKGSQLDWVGKKPAGLATDLAVPVQVTILDEPGAEPGLPSRAKRMEDALAALAARGGIRAIRDPVAWQREQREQWGLPGRDDAHR